MGHDVLLFSSVFRGVATPTQYFYLDQAIVDYAPGTFSAAESEQSSRFFTVMEGELKFTIGSKTDTYGPGKNFSMPPGVVVKGWNESQTVKARVFVSSLAPPIGARAATALGTRDSSPPPARAYSSRLL
jgi:quercetin dioxygenase-like cupin family protein